MSGKHTRGDWMLHNRVLSDLAYYSKVYSQLDDPKELAWIPECRFNASGWEPPDLSHCDQFLMGNDWTRYAQTGVGFVTCVFSPHGRYWLAQANHIFNRLKITSKYEDYCFVDKVSYLQECLEMANIPAAYYWSLDPDGARKLSTAEAEDLGLPRLQLQMSVGLRNWDQVAYTALRQFHQGKSFDPDTQYVARHLGYPLYQLSGEPGSPFAHGDY
ncbi:hypothetical protein B0H10DRAFT_2236720 [Mycena sp. CBHHK59/15]|nr:hypothetical protein B0H10DRAFT_2236720 [Mycena sp. CBHHK59/15]